MLKKDELSMRAKKVAVLDRLKNAAGPFLPIITAFMYHMTHPKKSIWQSTSKFIKFVGAYGVELDEKLDSIIQTTTHQKQL